MGLETMMDAALELPDQIHQGLNHARKADLPTQTVEEVLFVGMGGSSIGGALAARIAEHDATVPMHVVRNHEPPGYVGPDTLVLATSYSGNTQETLDATRACIDAGASVVALTTGGQLGPMVTEAGGRMVQAPEGYEPRAAVGWLLAANLGLLDQALPGIDSGPLGTAADRVKERLPGLAAEGGQADVVASTVKDGVIGVIGHDLMGTIARRWAGELAENSKRLAFHAELPEMGHNQVVGWATQPANAELILVRRAEERARERVRLDALADLAQDAGAHVVQARVGASGLAGVVEALVLGDLVSLHVARRSGVDPQPVDPIAALKERLAGTE